MVSATTIPKSDVAILNRLILPEQANLPVTAARAILRIDFGESDRQRMRELSRKAQDGTLTLDERAEIEGYERVGHLLDLMHSKARRSLKRNGSRR